MQFVGVVIAFAFAALLYWISDRAYDVSWVIGLPLRIFAFATAVGALFAVLGAALGLVGLVFAGLLNILKSAFGRSD